MSPVCVKCRVEMRVRQNGFVVEEMADTDRPYKIWYTDLWYCQSCGFEIVTGFAKEPYRSHYELNYEKSQQLVQLKYWPRPDMVPQAGVPA